MKLQQLRILAAIVQNGFNITAAAAKIRSSQPAMSRQLQLLEAELGFDIFIRSGTTLASLTKHGEQVLAHASRILHEERMMASIRESMRDPDAGTLSIGTTHTSGRR